MVAAEPTSRDEPPRPRSMGAPLRWLWLLVLSFGWGVWLTIAAALAVEYSGLLERMIEGEIARRLGPAAEDFGIADAELHWAERSITLRGVSFGEGGRDLYLETVDCLIGWSPVAGPHVERVEATSGRVRISRSLSNGIRGFGAATEAGPIPTVGIRDIDLALETPEWGDLPLGVIDVCLQAEGAGPPRIAGRLLPKLAPVPVGGTTGAIYLVGELLGGRTVTVRTTARDLRLSTDYLPDDETFESLRRMRPEVVFDLEGSASYALGQSVYPAFEARLTLSDGSFAVPYLEAAGERRVEDVAVELSASFRPGPDDDLWDHDSWNGIGHFEAAWEGARFEGWARGGDHAAPGQLAEAWMHADGVGLEPSLHDLVRSLPELEEKIFPVYRPEGTVDVSASLRLPEDWRPRRGLTKTLERALWVELDQSLSAAYHGPISRRGARDEGFPLRLDQLDGHLVYAFAPREPLPEQIGIFSLAGNSGDAQVRIDSSILGRPPWFLPADAPTWRSESNFYLRAVADPIPIGAELEAAFEGLDGVAPRSHYWDRYSPDGGALAFDLQLWSNPRTPRLGTRLRLDLTNTAMTMLEWPLPLSEVNGEVRVEVDGRAMGRNAWNLGFELAGKSPAIQQGVSVAGHAYSADPGPQDEPTTHFQVELRGLNVRHPLVRALLREKLPEAEDALITAGAAGFVNASVAFVRPHATGPEWTFTEVFPAAGGITLLPEAFPVPTRDVRGRLVTISETEPMSGGARRSRVETVIEPLVGIWDTAAGPVPIAIRGRFDDSRLPQLQVFGAGVDLSNPALLGGVSKLLRAPEEGDGPVAVAQVGLAGALDFAALLTLGEGSADDEVDLELHARGIDLGPAETSILHSINGRLRYRDDALTGDELRARVGITPVELSNLRFEKTGSTSWVRSDISARGLPIDAMHLRNFVSAETLETLLTELQWSGQVDIEDGRIEFSLEDSGESSLRFRGELQVADMFIRLGLPVSVRSADKVALDLTYEGDRVRAWAKIRELYGQVAERQLDDASMIITYVAPRLSIEDFSARFESGELRSMKTGRSASASFLSADLEPPFPFWLSIQMNGVDVGALTAGLFNSDFANQGTLSGKLSLRGNTADLLGIEGTGSVELRNSSLWSIPVFQALFSQLGFDTTAIFDDMRANLSVENGVIAMTNMLVRSDLLKLAGEGEIQLDGQLRYDLEVRYGLVDKLGPFTLLLYRIQNSLLRVAIRGDMSRPEVALLGIISQFLGGVSKKPIQLPLPSQSRLPARF